MTATQPGDPMDEQDLTHLVASRAGLRKSGEARRAIRATLGALRCALADEDARALGDALPLPLARTLERRQTVVVRNLESLYSEVERRERTGRGFAMEHAQVVFGALLRVLGPDLVQRLRRHLPSDVASLLRAPRSFPSPHPHVHAHPPVAPITGQTLSRGRPGFHDTIAEASGPLAHSGSVARGSAAHTVRMVETARSTRPGREDETLASARESDLHK